MKAPQIPSMRRRRVPRWMSTPVPVVLALVTAGCFSSTEHTGQTMPSTTSSSSTITEEAGTPKPLRGVPFTRSTGLRLLVANDPPFLLNVDSGSVTPVTGLPARRNLVLEVLAVGKDAVAWVDRRAAAGKVPRADIYVVRHGTTRATRLATAWDVAPAADGRAVWLLGYTDARHCTLREVGLDGRQRQDPRPVPCSARLVRAGSVALLIRGRSVVDPATGRMLLHAREVLAFVGHLALSSAGPGLPLTLTNLRSGARERLPWPSQLDHTDEVAVQPRSRLIAVAFGDPAYHGGGTQVLDVWLLDAATRRLQHIPDMPADVALKFTSMAWTSDGQLVMLAETGGRDVVAVWRPGETRIAVRPVRLPRRNSGSDTFVVW
jgi:hypothetical protein